MATETDCRDPLFQKWSHFLKESEFKMDGDIFHTSRGHTTGERR